MTAPELFPETAPGIAKGTHVDRWAVVSDDGRFRYDLVRSWAPELDRLPVIMLNPSIADGQRDDLTITKLIGFASRWGFGGIRVVNLFAYVATDPDDLVRAHYAGEDVVGPLNLTFVAEAIEDAPGPVLVGWGNNVDRVLAAHAMPDPIDAVIGGAWRWRRDLVSLGVTADGHPRHPSRLGGACGCDPWAS